MAQLAVNKDGTEIISEEKPYRVFVEPPLGVVYYNPNKFQDGNLYPDGDSHYTYAAIPAEKAIKILGEETIRLIFENY